MGLIAAQADSVEISNITVDTLTVNSTGYGNFHSAGGIVGYAEDSVLSNIRLYSTQSGMGITITHGTPAGGLHRHC